MPRLAPLAAALACTAFLAAAPAQAQDWYASVSGGLNLQSDSANRGALTGTLITGNGAPAVPDGTSLPSGTEVGWNTEFETGFALSAEVGRRFAGGLRAGLELAWNEADVDTHRGVTVGGADIDAVDAAVLTGSSQQLGVTVGEVVADGRGRIRNIAAFANLYYDFDAGGGVRPYVGAGVGIAEIDLRYNPSGVGIVDDSSVELAWQAMGGLSVRLSPAAELFGQYAYRSSAGPDLEVDLFPAMLEIENDQSLVTAGLRFRF